MDLYLLAVDDDPEFLTFLKTGLSSLCHLTTVENLKDAFVLLDKGGIDILLLDIGLGDENGLDALKHIKAKHPQLDVVMMSGYKNPKMIVEAIRSGASDYLAKPFEIEELIAVIEKLRPIRWMRERHAAFMGSLNEQPNHIIGNAPAFQKVLKQAHLVQGHKASLLIEAESGTGKEVLARYIHQREEDPARPFVAVNCAAIPENLLESEFFGHERGSFTGAHTRKIGKFELAHGGDLFLDEVSSLKWELQAKILRALQEKEITRVGGNEHIPIDFRVIAATNEDLEKRVEEGKFRRDLYHRLRVITFRLPPLRERLEDIPDLVFYFLKKYDPAGKRRFSATVFNLLQDYQWPGNIRELEHLIQSLVILVSKPEIKKEDLPDWIFRKKHASRNHDSISFSSPTTLSELVPLKDYVGKTEKTYILKVLEITRGDKSKTATFLNISRTMLYQRLKEWGVKI